MRPRRIVLGTLAGLLGGLFSGVIAEPGIPPSLADQPGEIDGRGAVALFVKDGSAIQGCRVHVAVESEPEIESAFPCAEWFVPPSYGVMLRAWIEGDGLMSPDPERFIPRDVAPGMMIPAGLFGPAGRVVLPGQAPQEGVVLRLLDADPLPLRVRKLPAETRRSVPPETWEEGVQMPAGKAVGWLWDSRNREILAVSREFPVTPGVAERVPLEWPTQRGHVAAVLSRARESLESAEDEEVKIELRSGGKQRPPDLLVPSAFRVYAFWYDLEPGPAELMAETPTALLPLQRFELREGRVERVAAELVRRPELEIEIRLPAGLEEEELLLEVMRVSDREIVAFEALKPGTRRLLFGDLPADRLEVRLLTSLGVFGERVDLSAAQDASVVLEPEIVAVSGRVSFENEGHPAKITFTSVAGNPIETRADDAGSYQALGLEPLRFVEVDLENGQPLHRDFFEKPLDRSQLLDFPLEPSLFEVKVRDARTGKPIHGAQVALRHSYLGEAAGPGLPGLGADPGALRKILSQAVATGKEGTALLPPLRPGDLELRASAPGYARGPRPATFVVAETSQPRTFELALEPEGPPAELALSLPDGRPASGAELLLVADLRDGGPVFDGKTDAGGMASVPAQPAGYLLVRHPEAAAQVLAWPSAVAAVRLVPPAAALRIRVENSESRPIPGAQLALWIDGHRLSGGLLAWLGRGRPGADGDGFLQLENLPPAALRAVAWSPRQGRQGLAGELDPLSVTVDYPWPDPVVLRGVE